MVSWGVWLDQPYLFLDRWHGLKPYTKTSKVTEVYLLRFIRVLFDYMSCGRPWVTIWIPDESRGLLLVVACSGLSLLSGSSRPLICQQSIGPESRHAGYAAAILGEARRWSFAWYCEPLANWGLLQPLLQSQCNFFHSVEPRYRKPIETLLWRYSLPRILGFSIWSRMGQQLGKFANIHFTSEALGEHTSDFISINFPGPARWCSFRLIPKFMVCTYCPSSRQFTVDPALFKPAWEVLICEISAILWPLYNGWWKNLRSKSFFIRYTIRTDQWGWRGHTQVGPKAILFSIVPEAQIIVSPSFSCCAFWAFPPYHDSFGASPDHESIRPFQLDVIQITPCIVISIALNRYEQTALWNCCHVCSFAFCLPRTQWYEFSHKPGFFFLQMQCVVPIYYHVGFFVLSIGN